MVISEANSCENNITDSKNNQSENLCYIYKHIRLDTNVVFYIGKGTNTDGKYVRAYTDNRTNPHWHRVVNKHGYKIEIIMEELTEQEAKEKEIELILHYGRRDLGTGTLVNLTDGGEGSLGRTVSDKTRKKIAKKLKGHKYNLGRKQSEEAKKKMSEVRPKKPVGKYKDGILIKEYPSIISTKLDGYNPGHVGACCRGKERQHKGFQWKFI